MEGLPQHLVDLFSAARLGYANGRDHAEVQPLLADVGYDAARIDALLADVDTAEAEAGNQGDAKDDAEESTEALRADYRAVRKAYLKHVKLARTVFDPSTRGYRALRLRGDRANATNDLLAQADGFYRTLGQDAGLLAALAAEVSIDQAAVDAQRAAVQGVRGRLATQALAKGGAGDLTESRDTLADGVEKEWGRFRKRARVALEDRPQLLEVLGIPARS